MDHVQHVLEQGHIHFGENKVQEALEKWTLVKDKNREIKLHLIGKLQTNKVKDAVKLFDVFHTLDREKLAKEFFKVEGIENKKFFIQVNTGKEKTKSMLLAHDKNSKNQRGFTHHQYTSCL